MNVFIDCGCWLGDHIEKYRKKYPDYKFYGFEPIKEYANEARKRNPNAEIIEKAVWIKNEKRVFYKGKSQGSTLFKSKTTDEVGERGEVEVDCIDFSEWLNKNFKKTDKVIVRMNMEGAEYPVLEKMLREKTIHLPERIMCEWHVKKIDEISTERHNRLEDKLKQLDNFEASPSR